MTGTGRRGRGRTSRRALRGAALPMFACLALLAAGCNTPYLPAALPGTSPAEAAAQRACVTASPVELHGGQGTRVTADRAAAAKEQARVAGHGDSTWKPLSAGLDVLRGLATTTAPSDSATVVTHAPAVVSLLRLCLQALVLQPVAQTYIAALADLAPQQVGLTAPLVMASRAACTSLVRAVSIPGGKPDPDAVTRAEQLAQSSEHYTPLSQAAVAWQKDRYPDSRTPVGIAVYGQCDALGLARDVRPA